MEETRKTLTGLSLFTGEKVITSAGQGQSVTMSEAIQRRLAKRSKYAQERTLSEAMMEEVTSHQNLLRSYRRVVSNGGSAGTRWDANERTEKLAADELYNIARATIVRCVPTARSKRRRNT